MSRTARLLLFGAVALGGAALDQWIKWLTRATLRPGESWAGGPIPGVFEFTLSYNRGVAFGALQGKAFVAIPIAVAIALACAWSVAKPAGSGPGGGKLKAVALGLLASGAIGNLLDRLLDPRGVTDMYLLRLANLTGGRIGDFPVFNTADVEITAAVILLMVVWAREGRQERVAALERAIHAGEKR